MLIFDQERVSIVNLEQIEFLQIDGVEINAYSAVGTNNGGDGSEWLENNGDNRLGTYESPERAREVLEDIMKKYEVGVRAYIMPEK